MLLLMKNFLGRKNYLIYKETQKAQKLLAWQPEFNFESLIEDMIISFEEDYL